MGKEKNFFHFKKILGFALYTITILKLFFFIISLSRAQVLDFFIF